MDVERVTESPRTILGVREIVSADALTDFFSRAFGRAHEALARQGVAAAGPPVAVYRGDPAHGFDVTAGFPVSGSPVAAPGIEVTELPAGPAVAAIHTGSYDSLSESYSQIAAWMKEQGLEPGEPMWEEYLAGPESSAEPEHWQTRIVFPVS